VRHELNGALEAGCELLDANGRHIAARAQGTRRGSRADGDHRSQSLHLLSSGSIW